MLSLCCHASLLPKDSVIVHDCTCIGSGYPVHATRCYSAILSVFSPFVSYFCRQSAKENCLPPPRLVTSDCSWTFDWSRFHFFHARACLWVWLGIGNGIELLRMLGLLQSVNQWDQAWTKSPSSSSLTTRSGKTIVLAFQTCLNDLFCVPKAIPVEALFKAFYIIS